MSSQSGRRDHERIVILGELRGDIMVFEPLQLKQISRSGALVETRFPLRIDSLHDVRLRLGSQSVVLKGRVTHSHIFDVDQDIVAYQTGLEFVDPPEYVQSVIDGFLDVITTERGGV